MQDALERKIENIERMLKILVEKQQPVWISEAEAMKIMGRGKEWFKKQRLGIGGTSKTLFLGSDWRRINGRTPEYKLTSIQKRKLYSKQKAEQI